MSLPETVTAALPKVTAEKKSPYDPTGLRTILCQIDNEQIERSLKKVAVQLGCRLISEAPSGADLIFMPHFVAVIDRNLLGEDLWDVYIDCCNDGTMPGACIVIDNLQNWRRPENHCILYIDQNDPKAGITIGHHIKHFDLLVRTSLRNDLE